VLADQDAGRRGFLLPFFGRLTSTYNGPASLAIRLGVPLVPAFCLRQPDGRFRLVLFPNIEPDPTAERAAEERRIMTEYNRLVETVIRMAPEQYFWWHRRWKTNPRRRSAPGLNQ
jgi:KDO2-lipid IV(A) lauroyltransferase